MKKSFFLSILAVGALVACSKSEVVDTKFDQAIGFENYVGRDAVTKAAVADVDALKAETYAGIGLYGFYTGNAAWNVETNSNLWGNEKLAWDGTGFSYKNTKYWTNDTDQYTFFAYAPYSESAPSGTTVKDPSVSFTVDETIEDQIDLLYSNNKLNTIKTENTSGVGLVFNHALSRITVKATENEAQYDYTIYGVSISGQFNTKGSLKLSDNSWTATPAAAEYKFLESTDTKVPVTAEGVDFAGSDNYLMIIPTTFTAEAPATLTVTYTTTYDGHESTPMTKSVEVAQDFKQGKAYSINLAFAPNQENEITFTVTVNDWEDEEGNENEETPVTPNPSNPEMGK